MQVLLTMSVAWSEQIRNNSGSRSSSPFPWKKWAPIVFCAFCTKCCGNSMPNFMTNIKISESIEQVENPTDRAMEMQLDIINSFEWTYAQPNLHLRPTKPLAATCPPSLVSGCCNSGKAAPTELIRFLTSGRSSQDWWTSKPIVCSMECVSSLDTQKGWRDQGMATADHRTVSQFVTRTQTMNYRTNTLLHMLCKTCRKHMWSLIPGGTSCGTLIATQLSRSSSNVLREVSTRRFAMTSSPLDMEVGFNFFIFIRCSPKDLRTWGVATAARALPYKCT